MLVVRFAELVDGVPFFPDEIVVGGEDNGTEAVDGEVDGQTFCKGGLPCRGGTGDQDDLDPVACGGYLVGDPGKFLLVQGLSGLDELSDISVGDGLVQSADRVDPQDSTPVLMLLIDSEEVRLILEGLNPVRVLSVRQVKNKAGRVGD